MIYTEAQFEAMRYDPIALRWYFWNVGMAARRRSLIEKREISERGRDYDPRWFDHQYLVDGKARDWCDVERNFAIGILDNLDHWVRGCLERPPVCKACRAYGQSADKEPS